MSTPSHSPAKAVKASIALLMQRLSLSRRQAEVLHWLAEGKTNDEISIILGCSFFTVKNHLKKIFQHLNVHSRTAAAACAYRAHIMAVHLPQHSLLSPTSDSPHSKSAQAPSRP